MAAADPPPIVDQLIGCIRLDQSDVLKHGLAHASSEWLAGECGAKLLHEAIGWRRTAIIDLLLTRGVPADVRDNLGQTPLMTAARMGDLKLTQLLIDLGADVDAVDVSESSVLMHAAGAVEGAPDLIVPILLKHGASAKYANSIGNSALHSAALAGQTAAVTELLQSGADSAVLCNGSSPLDVALSFGHLAAAEAILAAVDPNPQSHEKFLGRALIAAAGAWGGRSDSMVENLLKLGAGVGFADSHGRTALLASAGVGNRKSIARLLAAGAEVNRQSSTGSSPLHLACEAGHFSCVELLIQAGARIDQKDRAGWTPLMCAVRGGGSEQTGCVRLLLKAGADPLLSDKTGKNAFQLAQDYARAEILAEFAAVRPEILSAGGNEIKLAKLEHAVSGNLERGQFKQLLFSMSPLSKHDYQRLALCALAAHNADALEELAVSGLDVQARDAQGMPLAFLIIEERMRPLALKCFLNRGFDPKSVDPDGKSLLHILGESWSSSIGRVSWADRPRYYSAQTLLELVPIARQILKAGADVNLQDAQGRTPLMCAAGSSEIGLFRLFLSSGAKPDIQDCKRGTALMYACRGGAQALEQVKDLLARKADVELKDASGKDAMIYALESGNAKAVEMIRKVRGPAAAHALKQSPAPLELIAAVTSQNSQMVADLLGAGADPDFQASEGQNALCLALSQGSSAIVQLLLDAGANPALPGQYGRGPLHFCADRRDSEQLKKFLTLNADPNQKDIYGMTPAMSAAHYFWSEGLILLREAGADLCAKTEEGFSALMSAARAAHSARSAEAVENTLRLLLEAGAEVNAKDAWGNTSLAYACGAMNYSKQNESSGAAAAAGILLQNGADPALADSKGATPLDHAKRLGLNNAIKLFGER